jgi:hypothetical protein
LFINFINLINIQNMERITVLVAMYRSPRFISILIQTNPFSNLSSYVLGSDLILSSLYYIKNQQYATLAVLFISNCKITVHVSEASRVHHQEF